MKQQKEIEQQLITGFVSHTDKVTNFVLGGVIRAFFIAIAAVIAEVWNDTVQLRRSLFITTAKGAELDVHGARRGVPRLGATGSSAVLVFTGTAGTVVPANTQVRSASKGVIYRTKYAVTLGTKNPTLGALTASVALSDSVVAESTSAGTASRVPANSLINLVTPIAGITAVNNPAPSIGGEDAEPDDIYAQRMLEQIVLLNQGTQAFYERLAKEADPRVIRAKAIRDHATRGVKLILTKDTGANFEAVELTAIANAVQSRQRSTDPVTAVNISFTEITVEANTVRAPIAAPLNQVIVAAADALSNMIDWRRWEYGRTVQDDDILAVLNSVPDIGNIDLKRFYVNGKLGDVIVGENSLPKLVKLTILDKDIEEVRNLLTTYANHS